MFSGYVLGFTFVSLSCFLYRTSTRSEADIELFKTDQTETEEWMSAETRETKQGTTNRNENKKQGNKAKHKHIQNNLD